MILHGEGFIIRHQSGRYFRSDCYSPGFAAGTPRSEIPSVETIYRLTDSPFQADLVRTRQFCGRFLASPEWSAVAEQFEVVPRPGCGCCGSDYYKVGGVPIWSDGDVHRCEKHRRRDVCAVDGCRRTRAAAGLGADDRWLCSIHWKIVCPPRSAMRRAYLRFFRLAKKMGWTPELERRLDRFWRALVLRAQRPAEGRIDVAEIEKLFGWAA